jgi:hypothetical protein
MISFAAVAEEQQVGQSISAPHHRRVSPLTLAKCRVVRAMTVMSCSDDCCGDVTLPVGRTCERGQPNHRVCGSRFHRACCFGFWPRPAISSAAKMPFMSDRPDQETDDPLYADRRNFYKVEKSVELVL